MTLDQKVGMMSRRIFVSGIVAAAAAATIACTPNYSSASYGNGTPTPSAYHGTGGSAYNPALYGGSGSSRGTTETGRSGVVSEPARAPSYSGTAPKAPAPSIGARSGGFGGTGAGASGAA